MNSNGIQEVGEVGVAGVTVQLLDSLGTVLQTQQTSVSGFYLFDNLTPNAYSIQFILPTSGSFSSYAFTTALAGVDPSVDSDPNVSTGRTAQFSLTAGQALRTIDAGLVAVSGSTTTTTIVNTATTTTAATTIPPSTTTTPTVTSTTTPPLPTTTVPSVPTTTFTGSVLGNCRLSSVVWRDVNNNGIIDVNEAPYAGVTIQAVQGGLRFTAITNEKGEYTFNSLPCGDWTISIIDGLPAGVTPPPARTVRVLGVELTNDLAPFGIALQNDPALTGSNTLQSISFALSVLGLGGLMVSFRKRRSLNHQ